jgi:hypothetical protein
VNDKHAESSPSVTNSGSISARKDACPALPRPLEHALDLARSNSTESRVSRGNQSAQIAKPIRWSAENQRCNLETGELGVASCLTVVPGERIPQTLINALVYE